MIFFFDESVGVAVPRALEILGVRAIALQDHYPKGVQDDVWLSDAGDQGWIVIGHDRRHHGREVERAAILEHSVGSFYLAGANSNRWDKMRLFAQVYDRIVELAVVTTRPFVYRGNRQGRFEAMPLSEAQREAAATSPQGPLSPRSSPS